VSQTDAEAECAVERHRKLERDAVAAALQPGDAAVRDVEPAGQGALAQKVGAAHVP